MYNPFGAVLKPNTRFISAYNHSVKQPFRLDSLIGLSLSN